MGKEDNKTFLFIVLIIAVLLLANAIFSFISEIGRYTGEATSQTVTVSINITETVTNATTATLGASPVGGRPARDVDLTFITIPSMFLVTINYGELRTETLRIKNTGDLTLLFTLRTNNDNILIDKDAFVLSPEEESVIKVSIKGIKLGIFTGVITIKTDLSEKKIPVVVEVETPGADFGAELIVPKQFKSIKPGSEIFSTLKLTKLAGGFAEITYVIMNAGNDIIYQEEEDIEVENELSVDRTMKIPSFITPGTYAFGAVVHYKGETRTKAQLITLKESPRIIKPTLEQPEQLPPKKSTILIVVILLMVIIQYIFRRKRIKPSS